MLPASTKVLIVGAGPTGLCTAISLIKHGVSTDDITIVDAILEGENSSRATVVHSATLESLDTIGCADPLVDDGIKGDEISFGTRSGPLIKFSFSPLNGHTKYPFPLVIPQSSTEHILLSHLKSVGSTIHRPFRVSSLHGSKDGPGIDVSFEDGQVIRTKYVVGADGSHSMIRRSVGIGFTDPDGIPAEKSSDFQMAQLVLADVTLSPPKLLKHVGSTISNGGAFLLMPMTKSYLEQHGLGTNETAYRVAFSIPTSDGPPPSHPPLEYIQKHIDLKGPYEMSSNPAVTSQPVTVSKVIWSSRYRTASAIADRFFSVVPGENGHDGGAIMLVGDAAHIHSPAGGQGMNLGLRDAVGLGEKLAEHIKFAVDVNDYKILERYTSERHSRAEKVIGLTKGMNRLLGFFSGGRFFNLPFYFAAFIANLPIIGTMLNRLIAWRLSGLENA